MSIRSILILVSLAANIFLIAALQTSARKVQEARQLSLLEDTDLNRVRDLSGRVRPAGGLNPKAVNQDLAILQNIKSSVAEEINKPRSGRADLRCPVASRAELNQMVAQMTDYKKRLDLVMESGNRSNKVKDEMIRRVEEEALRIKDELLVLCAR